MYVILKYYAIFFIFVYLKTLFDNNFYCYKYIFLYYGYIEYIVYTSLKFPQASYSFLRISNEIRTKINATFSHLKTETYLRLTIGNKQLNHLLVIVMKLILMLR